MSENPERRGEDYSGDEATDELDVSIDCSQGQVVVLRPKNSIIELQSILKDKKTSHSDFVFHAHRLMRLVIEEGLNHLPYKEITITTPTHCKYNGVAFVRGNCGVSVCRSGEAMEPALRQCCRSVRICKILLGEEQRVVYARFCPDIAKRRVLLLYPIVTTGNTLIKAIRILEENGVREENIYILTIFCTPSSIKQITSRFSNVALITSEITTAIPQNFSMKYFGTD